MVTDQAIKKSVIASVLASVLVIVFIEPVLELLWVATKFIGVYVYEGAANRIYRNAAFGQRDWIAVILLFIAAMVPGYVIALAYGTRLGFRLSRARPEISRSRVLSWTFGVSVAVYFVVAGYLLLLVFSDLQLNTSFGQRVAALAPCLTEEREEELHASWALMRSASDYERIQENIDEFAAECGVELPMPLW